ncbi:MAG: YtxH domain-containing protein [Acidobacteriota bacterium]
MKRETSNVLVAFLLGAVAGGVTALLLAPASGAETRKKIKDSLMTAKDKALQELEHAKEYASVQKEAIKEAYIEGKEAYQRSLKKHSEA